MNFPTSPIEQHNRLIGSFCDDLLNRDREYPRSKVVALIVRKIREEGCAIAASGTVAGPASPGAKCSLVSAIRGPSTIAKGGEQ